MSFTDPIQMIEEGCELFNSGEKSAAALKFRSAKEAARAIGDEHSCFTALIFEAEAWRNQSKYRKALGILFEALTNTPKHCEGRIRALASKGLIEVQLNSNPDLQKLNRQIVEFSQLAEQGLVPSSDIHHLTGKVLYFQGRWSEALRKFGLAWHEWANAGYVRHRFPLFASQCCLRLGDLAGAKAWHQHLLVTDRDRKEAREERLRNELRLYLFEGDLAMRSNLDECRANNPAQSLECRATLFCRANSQVAIDDPADPSHPARKLAAPEREEDVHDRYDNLLTLVDYRLACLRFTAGLPAVDDLYYRQPEVMPTSLKVTDPARLQTQLRHFRFTWHLLRRHARRIDALLECDWRRKETNSRWNRAAAIATACNAELEPHA